MELLKKLRELLFEHIIVCDFEFQQLTGERHDPNAMCYRDLLTEERGQFRRDELFSMEEAPFPVDEHTLFVCHAALAELGCFSALNWPHPKRIYDTYIEEKCRRMGLPNKLGFGLIPCMRSYDLRVRDSEEKKHFQNMGQTGGPQCESDWQPYLDYCSDDVDDGADLFLAQAPHVDIPEACLRGRYMSAAAKIEHTGAPIDEPLFNHMKAQFPTFRPQLIAEVNPEFNCYDDGTFVISKFEEYLVRTGTPWPRLYSGQLDLRDTTFRIMAKASPAIARLRECRHAASKLNLFNDIAVGSDGRNRCWLNPFGSRTGRNQPSNAQFLFGTARSNRSLLKPLPHYDLAYLDFKSQEWLIGAALSNDQKMLEAYLTGDVYLHFAKQAGAVPDNATKETHRRERNLFKATTLATQYGMGEVSLAARIGTNKAEARELLRLHRQTYPVFWEWVDGALNEAFFNNSISTAFGWKYHVPPADEKGISTANPRSIMNFPCQAHGAEMLRLACVYLVESEICEVCCPVHDAVLLHMPTKDGPEIVAEAKRLMAKASADVLGGHECMIDADVCSWPNNYQDADGIEFWKVMERLAGPMPGS